MFSAPTNNRSRSNVKKILLIILTPAVQTSKDKNDVTIRSKSSAGSSYQDNWDAVFKKDQAPTTLH